MKKEIIYIIASIIAIIVIVKACEQEPKIVTKTEVKTVTVHDTVHKFKILEKPVKVFLERFKTLKGKDSIIYLKEPNSSTIEANSFKTVLSSNKAKADLEIVTTGELLDVKGVITYPEVTNTITTKITKAQSGLFLYGKVPISNFNSPEVGVLYQFKNSLMIGTGVQYNDLTAKPEFTATIGIKIF